MKKFMLSLVSVLCAMVTLTGVSSNAAYQTSTSDSKASTGYVYSYNQDRLKYKSYLEFKYGKPETNTYLTIKNRDKGIFKTNSSFGWYFYDLSDKVRCGVGYDPGFKDDTVPMAGYGDMGAFLIDGDKLKVQILARKTNVTCKNIKIEYEYDTETPVYFLYTKKSDPDSLFAEADLNDTSYKNGMYKITGVFKIDGKESECSAYLFINCKSNDRADNEFYLCQGIKHLKGKDNNFNPMDRRITLQNLLSQSGVNEENALTADTQYPAFVPREFDDSQYWKDLAHEIVKGNEKSSYNYQALLLHDWMTSHMKYDWYKVNVLKYPRYHPNGTSVDTSNYLSKNSTGVCLDFACIYTIMCRECGIPAVVVSNDTHAWNAIYLDNRWYEVDLTYDVNRYVRGKDLSVVEGDQLYSYEAFCTVDVNEAQAKSVTRFCW